MKPLSYTNRLGATYYLHEGRTKTGKPRYFAAKTVGEGALEKLPDGFELVESVNGVVSVRRADPARPRVPDEALAIVRAELARHGRLGLHRADVVDEAIVVFEPEGGFVDLSETLRAMGIERSPLASRTPRRFGPVLKFYPGDDDAWNVARMTYRGAGGWSWAIGHGPLPKLAAKYVPLVGTEAFFELM